MQKKTRDLFIGLGVIGLVLVMLIICVVETLPTPPEEQPLPESSMPVPTETP